MKMFKAEADFEAADLPDVGLVVFEEDPTSGPAVAQLFAGRARVQVARMPFARPDDDPLDLLSRAASRILPSAPPPLIGVTCTTMGMTFGPDRLASAVSRPGRAIAASDPMQAALGAMAALGAERIAIVCPYSLPLARQVADAVTAAGLEVATLTYLDVANPDIPRVSKNALAEAIRRGADLAASRPGMVFLSCTGLDTLCLINPLEQELGIPVVTSIQALAWDMARRLSLQLDGPGQLFALP